MTKGEKKKGFDYRKLHLILFGLIILGFVFYSFLNITPTGNPIGSVNGETAPVLN